MKLLQGDCLEVMESIEDSSIDMILTDPPYSSGGLFSGDRRKKTTDKYTDKKYNGTSRFPDFSGDNMDQRAFMEFMRMVLAKARRKSKEAGICAVFVDWRNIASLIDALQTAGWIYRGIVVWDKGNSRAVPGRFRNDCEYIVWGTNGQKKTEYEKGCFVGKGCLQVASVPSKIKYHQTEKPVELLERLLGICPLEGTVMDCFMGSGSTGVACVNTGRDFIGIELSEWYFEIAQKRISGNISRII